MEDSNPDLQKVMDLAIADIARGMDRVGSSLDDLSSAGLKRVLKTVSHVHLAESILKNKHVELQDNEQSLIDQIFALQENVMGYMQIKNELESEDLEGEENE